MEQRYHQTENDVEQKGGSGCHITVLHVTLAVECSKYQGTHKSYSNNKISTEKVISKITIIKFGCSFSPPNPHSPKKTTDSTKNR